MNWKRDVLFLGRSDCTWERLLGFLLFLLGLYHHFAATFPYTDSNTIQLNLIEGGVVTNLEIVIGIDGLALPNARVFAAEKKFS